MGEGGDGTEAVVHRGTDNGETGTRHLIRDWEKLFGKPGACTKRCSAEEQWHGGSKVAPGEERSSAASFW